MAIDAGIFQITALKIFVSIHRPTFVVNHSINADQSGSRHALTQQ